MRLVLDTQVWIDWLVFDDPAVAKLREEVDAGRAEIVIDEPCRAELARVLGYKLGRRRLAEPEQAECLERLARVTKCVSVENRMPLPPCSDPDDQKFLELAAAAAADCLVTRDQALLALARRSLPFRILPPGSVLQARAPRPAARRG